MQKRLRFKPAGTTLYPLDDETAEQAARQLGYAKETLSRTGITLTEALYLIYKGYKIEVNGEEKSFKELLAESARTNPYAWVELEVYIDLRRRGRIIHRGPRPHTFLVKRRKNAPAYDYYVLVLEENRLIPLRQLTEFVEEARKNDWTPLLAIVDRYGDIVYYTPIIFRAAPGAREIP